MPPNSTSESRKTSDMSTKISQQTTSSANQFIEPTPSQSDQRLSNQTLNIVRFVIYSLLSRKKHKLPSPVAKKVLELTTEILAKHDVYNGLCVSLNLSLENLQECFYTVAENIFVDDLINWGRMIALLGFSVKVAEYLSFKGFGNQDEIVIEMTTRFIVGRTGPWIESRGGWENIIAHFSTESSPRNRTWIKNVLVTATATIGLGALLAITCK